MKKVSSSFTLSILPRDGRGGINMLPSVAQCLFKWDGDGSQYQPASYAVQINYEIWDGATRNFYPGNVSTSYSTTAGAPYNMYLRWGRSDGTFTDWTAKTNAAIQVPRNTSYAKLIAVLSTATARTAVDDTNIVAQCEVPIIFADKPGRGIESIVPWFVLSKKPSGVTLANTSGWTTTALTPTWDNPYLWRYYRTTYTDNTTSDTPPEMVTAYTPAPGENLLEDTGFDTAYAMGAWDIQGQDVFYGGTTGSNSTGVPAQPGTMAHKSYQCTICGGSAMGYWFRTYNSSTGEYGLSGKKHKNILRQKVWTSSSNLGANRVEGGKWYTLSFWLKCDAFNLSGDTADNEEPSIYDRDDWFGVYFTGDSNENLTLWNKNVQGYVDGEPTTFNRSGVRFVPSTSWTRHTITFQAKTASSLSTSPLYLYFRGFPSFGGTSYDNGQTFSGGRNATFTCYICMPKLEEGLVATSYMDNAVNRLGASLRPRSWAASVQYFRGAMGEPYTDVVEYDEMWYECIQTHTSNNSRKPGTTGGNAYWKAAQGNFEFVATKLLLARNAYIRLLTGNAITLAKENGTVTAGISGVGELADSVRFWAGAETPSTAAPFAVTQDGTLYSKKAIIEGLIKAKQMYAPTKVVYNSNMTINPETDGASCYFVHSSVTANVALTLPSPSSYDGMEIRFMRITTANNVNGSLTINYSGGIYIKDPYFKTVTAARLGNNSIATVKSMDGKWWVIEGDVSDGNS